MSILLSTLFLSKYSAPIWGAIAAIITLIVSKFVTSPREKKQDTREDFKVITDSLLRDVSSLREEIDRYKNDAAECENKYNELQQRFVEFKQKYSELEVRYKIQVEINRKLGNEIRELEAQLSMYINKELNDRKETTDTDTSGTTEE